MTGFGQAAGQVEGVMYTVEIKTVNNRYTKINMRLCDALSFCEEEIEKLLRENIGRGSVNMNVKYQNLTGTDLFEIDQPTLKSYASTLKEISESLGLETNFDLAALAALPGVVTSVTPEQDRAEKIKKTVLDITAQAIDKLKKMRLEEGKSLVKDMLANCEIIEKKLKEIASRGPAVIKEYHQKLSKRVEELLNDAKVKMDQDILAREVAVFAERADIAEEVTRLQSHLQQFRTACDNDKNIGRKLDFIAQEMLREANTIASKSGDSEICQDIIEIKCAIDRIKEQVQNVE
jgi:uncharacterized protein (TIGR00255 family)